MFAQKLAIHASGISSAFAAYLAENYYDTHPGLYTLYLSPRAMAGLSRTCQNLLLLSLMLMLLFGHALLQHSLSMTAQTLLQALLTPQLLLQALAYASRAKNS